MNTLLFLPGLAAIFVGGAVLWWLLLAGSSTGHRRVIANLNRDLDAPSDLHAVGEAASSELAEALRRRTPPAMMKTINRLWAAAGRPEAWPIDRVLTMKMFGGLAGFVLMLGMILGMRNIQGFLMGLALTLALFFLPEILLYNNGIKRKQAIGLQLPDTLDQMSIAVNAGLGFDAAMARVAKNGRGELASELVRTLQDIQVGMTRRDAYMDLADRTGVDKLERFVRAIIQGETYGIALSDVLQSQADELRMERRQDAERRAMQIPVKVVFPLILFIMPAMFMVVIGPGAIQAYHSFTNSFGH